MKTIFGKIATFVSGTVFGVGLWQIALSWIDYEDNSFIIGMFPNARQRYAKDIECAREQERAKVKKELKDVLKFEEV